MASAASDVRLTGEDPVSNVLKWILLFVGIATFAALGWTTFATYAEAPPQPNSFVTSDGTVLLTNSQIFRGKEGFQRADLMDYGSLYGMGSYFGEDYTADGLVRLAALTEANLARAEFGRDLTTLTAEQRTGVRSAMQTQLKSIDLTQSNPVIPRALGAAIVTLREQIAAKLLRHDFVKGWTKAYSLDAQAANDTASFLIYSSLTTVARRPGTDISWTQNWPYEPVVGNTPTAARSSGPGSASVSRFSRSAPFCTSISVI